MFPLNRQSRSAPVAAARDHSGKPQWQRSASASMPGEGRVRADLHHRGQPRLRERRAAARRSRKAERLAVARLVGQVQRRAVEGRLAQPAVPRAGRPGMRQRRHAAVAERRDAPARSTTCPTPGPEGPAISTAGRRPGSAGPRAPKPSGTAPSRSRGRPSPPPAVAATGPQRGAHRLARIHARDHADTEMVRQAHASGEPGHRSGHGGILHRLRCPAIPAQEIP